MDRLYTLIINKIPFKQYVLAFTAIVMCFSIAQVQAQTSSGAGFSQSDDLQIATIEQSYDSQVIQVISNHFDRKKFFVDVNIDADIIQDTITTQNQILTSRNQNIALPGLPFLPDDNLQNVGPTTGNESALSQNVTRRLILNNIIVNIYADTSFSVPELDFMRQIAGFAAKTNPARGDQINITQLAIPDPDFEPIPIESTNINEQVAEPETFFSSLGDYITEFILIGLFILSLIANSVFYRDKQSSSNLRLERASFNLEGNFPGNNNPSGDPFAGESRSLNITTSSEEEFSMKEFDELAKNFFTKPEETALLLEYWIDEDPVNGATKAAEIIASGDSTLIRSIKKDLPEEKYEEIVQALEELSPMTIEEKNKAAKYFNTLIKEGDNKESKKKNYANLGLFKFLEHVTNHQLMELLKNETNQTAALVIDYLPEDKAAELLNKLDGEKAAEIMLKMSTLHNLTYKQHSFISSRLFDKVVEIRDVEKQEKMGMENILPILEKLPVKEQKKYIEQIKASGSVLGEMLEKQFLTIDQIPDLDNEIIKEGVEALNTPTLLDSLVGLDKEIIDKILAVRPKREQKLIRMELEEMEGSDGTDQAKSKLLSSLRKSYTEHLQEEVVE